MLLDRTKLHLRTRSLRVDSTQKKRQSREGWPCRVANAREQRWPFPTTVIDPTASQQKICALWSTCCFREHENIIWVRVTIFGAAWSEEQNRIETLSTRTLMALVPQCSETIDLAKFYPYQANCMYREKKFTCFTKTQLRGGPPLTGRNQKIRVREHLDKEQPIS